jgi:hypothetical protein
LGAAIYNLSLAQNVGAVTDVTRRAYELDLSRTLGQFSFVFPPLAQAALLMTLYTALFLGLAWWSLHRRDVRAERS